MLPLWRLGGYLGGSGEWLLVADSGMILSIALILIVDVAVVFGGFFSGGFVGFVVGGGGGF